MSEPLPRAIVLLSGGMDSTTLLYSVRASGYSVSCLSVHYGQRHRKELEFAMGTTRKLGVPHQLVDLGVLGPILGGSSLTDNIAVPEGHYTDLTMAQTVVPNRNAILLALAYAYAVTQRAVKVCTAVHSGDHAIYPDCRPEFAIAFEAMEKIAIDRVIYGMAAPQLYAPFILMSKADIAKHGQELGVPWEDTFSCYKGGDVHCAVCGTCCERISSFHEAGVEDPTVYEPTGFERTVAMLKDRGEWK